MFFSQIVLFMHYWSIIYIYIVTEVFDYSQIMRYECSIRWIPITTTNGSASILAYILTGIPRKAVRRPVKPLMPRLLLDTHHDSIGFDLYKPYQVSLSK